ncbi:MAG TPA: amidohydrolase [Polyangia bacterium]|jgi:hypothetical protein
MTRTLTAIVLAALWGCGGLRCGADRAAPADTILTNARVYTVDASRPWAEAVAIRGERIVGVGTAAAIARLRGPHTRVMDVHGRLVLPGFTDAHVHFLQGSLSLSEANLEGAESVGQIQERLRAYAAAHPGSGWLTARGWTYAVFGDGALPDKKHLDEIFPDRPVLLTAYDGHTVWANSAALRLARIDRNTPDPPHGTIVRARDGEPTGALRGGARELVRQVIPPPARAQKLAALRRGLAEANRLGVTRVHGAGLDWDALPLLDELRRRGELTLRVLVAYQLDPRARPAELTPAILDEVAAATRTYHDAWIATGTFKMMLDGIIEAHTAALLEPYADDPSQRGRLYWDRDRFIAAVTELDRRGLQVETHAIGDAAVRLSLDAYEAAAARNHSTDRRHRVVHVETIAPADVPRFGRLGVIASLQPLHAYPERNVLRVWTRNVGPARSRLAFAWRSIAAAGGRLAFGSDWPIVALNPWPAVQTAITRQDTDGNPPGGWIPGQRIALAEAIRGYTLGAAYAGHRESEEGSITPGKLADLVVLSQDPFAVEPHAIGETQVLLTIVGGRIVYDARPR